MSSGRETALGFGVKFGQIVAVQRPVDIDRFANPTLCFYAGISRPQACRLDFEDIVAPVQFTLQR